MKKKLRKKEIPHEGINYDRENNEAAIARLEEARWKLIDRQNELKENEEQKEKQCQVERERNLKERELQRKEEYLKKLEHDLLKKEEEISKQIRD